MEKTLKTGKIGQFGAESRITYGGVKWVVLDARPNMSLCLAEDVLKDENDEVRYMAFDTDVYKRQPENSERTWEIVGVG